MEAYKKRKRQHILLILILVGSFAWSIFSIPKNENLLHAGGLELIKKIFMSMTDIKVNKETLTVTIKALWITLVYASASMGISIIIGLVFGLLSSNLFFNGPVGTSIKVFFRGFIGFLRGIHELIWAWLFVAAIGLTPFAGIFALAIPYGGLLAINYCNNFNSIDKRVMNHLTRSGASKTQAVLYGCLPKAFSEMVSFTLTNFECCIRSSTIMSFVGLGGIGYQIQIALRDMRFELVWMNVIALIILVSVIDLWSNEFRKRIAI